MDAFYRPVFPHLVDVASKKTSEKDQLYNCIAWAFSDNQRHWWPSKRSYWPFDCSGMTTAEAFEELFRRDGWEATKVEDPEPGYNKIALYELNGEPTHAARLLESGHWTSKLGPDIDLSHSIADLEGGPEYGNVVKIYRKPFQSS